MLRGARRIGLLGAIAFGVPLACGGSRAKTVAPPPAAAPTAPPATASPTSANMNAPPGQAGPLASVFTTDPNALATLLAQAAAAMPATRSPAAATPDAAEAGLRAAAAQFAPGLTPEGDVAKATLTESGHANFTAQLEPTKCYAIVAYGDGLTDLDVSLLLPPFYNLLAGQDGMTGAAAVIGASPTFVCPVMTLPVPYKIDLFAKKGGGAVAAQIYSKPK